LVPFINKVNYDVHKVAIVGAGPAGYLYAFETVVNPALKKFKPDLIAVASGFDLSVYDSFGQMLLLSRINN
jgi:acetoin utilization deacetylase AcuC-like enzyme